MKRADPYSVRAKRKLNGTRRVVTENLTRRMSYLLRIAITIEGVTATWTIDGRIICLLTNGNKEIIQTDADLDRVKINVQALK